MASLYNDEIAFIHVPKTGGQWVAEALRAGVPGMQDPPPGDNPYMGDHRYHHQMPDDRFRFGFVRDPVTWYLSYYCFVKRVDLRGDEGDLLNALAREAQDFSGFVRLVTTRCPAVLTSLYDQYLGPPGEVDYVGRYEFLTDHLVHALTLARVEFDEDTIRAVAPVNASSGDQPEITSEDALRIIASELQAIEHHGYDDAPALVG